MVVVTSHELDAGMRTRLESQAHAILASQEQDGRHTSSSTCTTYLDQTQRHRRLDVTGELNAGASYGRHEQLSIASASGTVPVTRYVRRRGQPLGAPTTRCVSATWTGQGQLTQGNQYVDWSGQPGGLTYVDRGSGTFRQASATATIGGQTFDASELQFADFGVSNDLTLTVCPHGC